MEPPPVPPPSFGAALRFWLKLGCISFGGPTGQIALMHEELVVRRRWIDGERFQHALSFCMLLPGPEAQQLATYVGWMLHRTPGAVAAGTLFVLPSALLLWLLSWIYVAAGDIGWVGAAFDGVKPAVVAIVAGAVWRIGRRALRGWADWTIAAAALGSIALLHAPFPVIVAGAAAVGFAGSLGRGARNTAPHATSVARLVRVVATCLVVWWVPVAALAAWLGGSHTLVQQGVFFSKAAMVTFGGAYAVLPYVAQQAVERFGWLGHGEMLDGLGLAESTPGPLIMVLQFVGFVGAWHHPGNLPPLVAATLGAAITTWTTFVPCFLWILAGAPYVEGLRGRARLAGALSGVSAAVVGVVANLALMFGAAVVFPGGAIDPVAATIAIVAFAGLQRFRWNVVAVIAAAAAAGVVVHALR